MASESIGSRTRNKKVLNTRVHEKRSCLVKLLTAFKSMFDKFETVDFCSILRWVIHRNDNSGKYYKLLE
jgi:hypothetical protein